MDTFKLIQFKYSFRLSRAWWTTEDYKKITMLDKVIFLAMLLLLLSLTSLTAINCFWHHDRQLTWQRLVDKLSICVCYFIIVFGILWINYQRNLISQVLNVVNVKSRDLLIKLDSPDIYCEYKKKIKIFSIGFLGLLMVMTLLVCLSSCV